MLTFFLIIIFLLTYNLKLKKEINKLYDLNLIYKFPKIHLNNKIFLFSELYENFIRLSKNFKRKKKLKNYTILI